VDVAEESGFLAVNHTGKAEQKDWLVSAMGGGAMAIDYDADGDQDAVVVDGTMLTADGELVYEDAARTRLFRNDGGMKFTDVTKAAGIDLRAFGFGGASCDYDADGFEDFFVACWGRNHLYRNRGDGTFEDVTEKAGVAGDEKDMSTACCFGDVNGDGIQDLYVANYCDQRAFIEHCLSTGRAGRSATWRELKVYVGPSGLAAQKDRLYLGDGKGNFRDVTDTNLLEQRPLYGFQPVMSDLDNDGDLDIFVANDTQTNHMWVNDGKGVFRDRSIETSVAASQDGNEQACMGVDVADLDQDGRLDITITNFSHDYNTIYLNRLKRGVLTFTDSSNALGIAQASYFRLAWGIGFVDFDNDGWLDHMTACGHVYGEIANFEKTTGTSYRQQCQMLRGTGPTSWKVEDVTDAAGPAFKIRRVWRGTLFADFDDDGDIDIEVAALNDKSALFRNDGGNKNAFLRFRLVGKGGLRDPSGARVTVHRPDGRSQLWEHHNGASFCGDNDPRASFGLGDATSVPKVEISWPGGGKQTFTDVPTRRAFVVEEGVDELRPDPALKP
jgi:hypothetical protein